MSPLPADINVNEAAYAFFGDGDEAVYANIKTAIDGGLRADGAGAGRILFAGETSVATAADIAMCAFTVPAGVRPILIHIGHHVTSTVALDTAQLLLYVGAVLNKRAFAYVPTASGYVWVHRTIYLPASASARAVDMRCSRFAGTGTVTAEGSADYPGYLIVQEV